MTQKNVYEDGVRAASYATLEFPGTYSLAFRDLPALISAHVRGARALDFGWGRSLDTVPEGARPGSRRGRRFGRDGRARPEPGRFG